MKLDNEVAKYLTSEDFVHCPFCGEVKINLIDNGTDNMSLWLIECSRCHVSMQKADLETVFNAWNNRNPIEFNMCKSCGDKMLEENFEKLKNSISWTSPLS